MTKQKLLKCWLRVKFNLLTLLLLSLFSFSANGQLYTVKKIDPNENPENIQVLILKKTDTLKLLEILPKMINLEVIDVSSSGLQSFPEALCNLPKLREITLGNNEISTIPACICKLENLVQLSFWDNNLYFFPDCLSEMTSLKILDLYGMEYNYKEQEELKSRFPNIKLKLSQPCSCHFD